MIPHYPSDDMSTEQINDVPEMRGRRFNDDSSAAWWVLAIQRLTPMSAMIAIACYVVFRLMSGIPTSQDIQDIKLALGVHVSATNEQMVAMRLVLQQICYNSAKNDYDRTGCAGR